MLKLANVGFDVLILRCGGVLQLVVSCCSESIKFTLEALTNIILLGERICRILRMTMNKSFSPLRQTLILCHLQLLSRGLPLLQNLPLY